MTDNRWLLTHHRMMTAQRDRRARSHGWWLHTRCGLGSRGWEVMQAWVDARFKSGRKS